MDLNTAITAYYSDKCWGDIRLLRNRCADDECAVQFATQIDEIGHALWLNTVEHAGQDTLSAAAIEQLARDYMGTTGLPIEEQGFQALLSGLLYNCMHNGYLERPTQTSD